VDPGGGWLPPCSSSTAQGKSLQEISDPRKLRTLDGISCSRQGDGLLCRSGTTQGTRASETRKRLYGTETDVQDETRERPRIHNRNKGPRHKNDPLIRVGGFMCEID
jgi:hypothetical protein